MLDEVGETVLRCGVRNGRALPELCLAGPERAEDGGADRRSVAYGGEFGEVDGSVVRLGGLQGEPCLADAAGPGEGDEPSVVPGGGEVPEFGVAADEGVQAGGQGDRPVPGGDGPGGRPVPVGGGPVVRQEFGVQGAQFGPGVRAEPVREGRAHLLVRRQGLGGPSGRSQGADPQGLEGFVEGLSGGEGGERREDLVGPSQGQVGGEPVAARPRVPLFDPYDQGIRVPAREVGEGGAAPEPEGLVEQGGGPPGVPGGQGGGPVGGEPLEAVQVDVVAGGGEAVAAGLRGDGLPAQGPAQPADEAWSAAVRSRPSAGSASVSAQTCSISAPGSTARPPAAARAASRARSLPPLRTASVPSSVRRARHGPRTR